MLLNGSEVFDYKDGDNRNTVQTVLLATLIQLIWTVFYVRGFLFHREHERRTTYAENTRLKCFFFFAELNQFIYIPDTMALKKSGSTNYITEHNVQ